MFAERYCYTPPAEHHALKERRENLLWPVYAWKVLYPDEFQRRGINLFQETLLGLIRAGMREADQLADAMALDPELVRFIIAAQLQPNGWLDGKFRLTPDGERLLDEAEDRRLNLKVGYAFQDAVSGNWLPRFTTQLPEISPGGHDEKNRPVFVLDRDKGRQERAFMLHAQAAAKLDTSLLLPAYRQYRQDLAFSQGESGNYASEVTFTSIESIDDVPTKLYLWCELYRDEEGLQHWLISDPFRVRRAVPWLREPFAAQARGNKAIARRMQRLLPEIPADGLSAEDWMELLDESADLEIEANYPFLNRELLIRDHLARVLRQKRRIEDREKVHPEEWGNLMTEAANLLEAVLKWLLREWRVSPPWPKGRNWSPMEARAELGALPLVADNTDLINALAGQTRKAVSSALEKQNQPLKALLTGTLFAASERIDHPFHELLPDALELERLPRLADYRNKTGGHASGEKAEQSLVLDYANFAIQWMALFNRWY